MMKIIKFLFKKFLSRYGYAVVNKELLVNKPFNLLEIVIGERICRDDDFYFIQIGANDGVRSDPLRNSILKFHLQGLLVEPLPDVFEQLKKNYSSEKQLAFENCAIAEVDGEKKIYRFKNNAPVPMEYFYGLARFDRNYIYKRAKENRIEEWVEEIVVPTLTFNSLIKKHKISKVTLLQVDTEGYDYQILKMAFETKIYPEIINYEHTEITLKERIECQKMLIENGYYFINIGPDTLAIHNKYFKKYL